MNNKGISVISLVITIIVLILITSVTVYNGMNVIEKTKKKSATDRLMTVAVAITSHENDLGYKDVLISGISGDIFYFDNNTADLLSDDKVANIVGASTEYLDIQDNYFTQISPEDYKIMGIDDFANTEDFPPIYVLKAPNVNNNNEKIYLLKTPDAINKNGVYAEEDFEYYLYRIYSQEIKNNFKIEFDAAKGVNRPLLTENMIPVKTYFAGTDYDRFNPAYVQDVYKDDWYNYSKASPMWANVMMKNTQDSYSIANRYYVWIPRFAYNIQDFYKGVDYLDIPSTAINIVFLRENTDYMANGEVLPTGYQVHPAFKYKNEEGEEENISGFWVAKDYVATCDGVYSASSGKTAISIVDINYLHPGQFDSSLVSSGKITSRLIKNTEWAAIAYLSMYTVGRTSNGNSLDNNPSGIIGLNNDVGNLVAGGLDDSTYLTRIPYMDRYSISGDRLTYYSYESANNEGTATYTWNNKERKFGDAMIITSTGSGDHGSWFGGYSKKLSEDEPFIVRGDEDGNLFSYRAIPNSGEYPAVRNVLIIKGS